MTVLAQPRLLDLCCKAGGASRGYDDAGFLVTGLDHEPQPRYPYEFIQADVLGFLEENAETLKDRYDAIGASFPCILFSSLTRATGKASEHLDLVTPGRSLLDKTGLPYVIEERSAGTAARPGDLLRPVVRAGSHQAPGIRDWRRFHSDRPAVLPCARRRR